MSLNSFTSVLKKKKTLSNCMHICNAVIGKGVTHDIC